MRKREVVSVWLSTEEFQQLTEFVAQTGYLNTKITLADTGKASAVIVKNLEIIKNFNLEA